MKHDELTDELQEQAILYAAGALDEEEREKYKRHLEEDDCTVCRAEVVESESAVQSLTFTLPVQTPSDSVKQRLLARAEAASFSARRSPERVKPAYSWGGWLVAAAALVLLAVLFNLNMGLRGQVQSLNARVVELESRMNAQQTLIASFTSEGRVVNLAGQGETPQARGRIFWNEADRRWHVFVTNLAPASSNRSYQLWFVPVTGNPVSAQVFNTTADGSAEIDIPLPAGITTLKAAAVTEEPAGGSPLPTGKFVLLGSI